MVGAELSVEGYACRTRSTALLGGDDDHAVGATRAIDGCGGGILQDGHLLDVGWVDGGNVAIVRRAVHDIQRLCARAHGTETTNANLRRGAWLTALCLELHAGHATGQGLSGVGNNVLGNVVCLHLASRASE